MLCCFCCDNDGVFVAVVVFFAVAVAAAAVVVTTHVGVGIAAGVFVDAALSLLMAEWWYLRKKGRDGREQWWCMW